jgi:alkanesulfonate monooxygenase SsuD/methylene tetrahydromethanopterin reductase-like flavin-dependent oxidoreductase (luciferase family)
MRRLGAERADGLLLSWLTPATASAARDEAVADATAAGRAAPRVVLYARAIAEPGALGALVQESARYAGYPNYAANFARIGHGALDATIRGVDHAALASGIDGYVGAVDELVLRAITVDDSADAVRRFIDAVVGSRCVAPRGNPGWGRPWGRPLGGYPARAPRRYHDSGSCPTS